MSRPVVRLALALVLLAGASGPLLSQPAWSPPAGRLAPAEHYDVLSRADRAYEAAEWAAAVPLYERVVASDPRNGEAVWRLARSRFESGDAAAAIRDAERALAMGFGDEAGASFRIAAALAAAGRGDEAMEWIERSLAAGYEDRPDYRLEDPFQGLRDDPRFRELAGLPPTGEADREARWAYDLDFFLKEARRLHAGPDDPADAAWFADSVEALKRRVASLSDIEVFAHLFRVTVLLGDGHSVLYPMPTEAVPLPPLLPASFWVFSDGVHVIEAADPDLVGAKVLAIDGHPIEDVLAAAPPWLPKDNPMGVLWSGPLLLRFPPFLAAMGFVEDPASVAFTFADRAGVPREETLTPGGGSHPSSRLLPPPGDPPAWLARINENYWLEPRPDLNALYVQYNRVRDDDETIEAFARRAKAALEGRRNLILDVRHNNGGNNFLNWPLVRLAMWHEMEDPANRVWVITSRNTFSAAQDFVNFLDRETGAIFVGEPSSSRPNFVGEDTFVMLPYSRLRVSISSRYWQDSWPGDERIWIPVEVPVELSSSDWLEGRDPAMEALATILSR